MSTNTMTMIFLILLEFINASILKEEIQGQKLFISLKLLDNSEVMNFYNIEDEFIDQIKCTQNDCSCFFTSESQVSGLINNISCQSNMISFFRTNINVKTIPKQIRRITTQTYSDSDMPNSQTISSGFTLKWKFNSDETIEFATIWNKLTWLGIGFGSNMKNVDMITINVQQTSLVFFILYQHLIIREIKNINFEIFSLNSSFLQFLIFLQILLQTNDLKFKNL